MSYRLFEDSTGIEWQVWDVVPRLEERRAAAETDRRVEINVIPFADRRGKTRRLANARRLLLRGAYSHGWLCFESRHEKRRLSPIPGDWTTCDEATLELYLREGARVAAPGRLMTFDNEAPPQYPEAYAEAG